MKLFSIPYLLGHHFNYEIIVSSNKDIFYETDNWLKTLEKLEVNAEEIINFLKKL